MKAVVYEDVRRVGVREVADAAIEDPGDAVVRVSSSAICGTDLHMYDGRTGAEPGLVLGHEPVGTVEQTGPSVATVARGQRVVVPTHLLCGVCFNCARGYTAACLRVRPGQFGAAYGYAGMGPYRGAQAELLRCRSPTPTSSACPERRWTGSRTTSCCSPTPSSPAGTPPSLPGWRWRTASRCSAPAPSACSPPTAPCSAAPARSTSPTACPSGSTRRRELPTQVVDDLARLVNPTGRVGIAGVYAEKDLAPAPQGSRDGSLRVPWAVLFDKGVSVGFGRTSDRRYTMQLRDLIVSGRARPGRVVTHPGGLDDAPGLYQRFDRREDGVVKAALHA